MTGKHTIRGIQVLRGLAACMVVIVHSTQRFANLVSDRSVPFWGNGASGVDVFFIISGFVMAVSTPRREDKPHPAGVFLRRRLIRLVPMYWAMTILFIVITVWSEDHAPGSAAHPILIHTRITWTAVMLSLSYIPYRSPLGIQPILAVGWTLSYEVFFYLLFAAALALRVSVVTWLTPSLFLLASISIFRTTSWPAFTVVADPLLLEFAAGLLLGNALLKGYRGKLIPSLALGLLAFVFLLFGPSPSPISLRVLTWGLPAFFVVHAVLALEPTWGSRWPSWALLLGDCSYSLYLSHNMVMNVFFSILVKFHLAGSRYSSLPYEFLDAMLCLLLTVAVALVLYRFVEQPLTEALKRHLAKEPKLPPALAGL